MSARMYNGRPLFSVGFSDFVAVSESVLDNKRLLSRNIVNPELRQFFINSRKPSFAVVYDDVIVSYGGR